MRNLFRSCLCVIAVIIVASIGCFAQDHMYSQFFNSPIYLNPALTGQFPADLRMNLIYRNQFTSVPGSFNYFTGAIDYNIPKFGGGIGLIFTRGAEGTAYFSKNNIAGTYSYSVGSEDFILSFGIQAGVTNDNIDWSKLVFDDQINSQIGFIPGSVTAAQKPAIDNKFFFDAGAGVNLVVSEFDLGASLQHINHPNESFTYSPFKLPERLTGHVSYRMDLNPNDNNDENSKSFIIPSAIFYQESSSQSLNVGFQYKRQNVNAGFWYRTGGQDGPAAVVVSLIFDLYINPDGGEKIRLGVSHDVPTTGLNYSNTAGTTEVSVGYETTIPSRSDTYHKFEGARHCYDFY